MLHNAKLKWAVKFVYFCQYVIESFLYQLSDNKDRLIFWQLIDAEPKLLKINNNISRRVFCSASLFRKLVNIVKKPLNGYNQAQIIYKMNTGFKKPNMKTYAI